MLLPNVNFFLINEENKEGSVKDNNYLHTIYFIVKKIFLGINLQKTSYG